MSRPFISFLVIAWKTEHIIGETIQSVLAQTRPDWEVIVVDNGNSDEMARVVESFTGDSRIKLVRQENKGIGGGTTAAAAVASGRYLCPLNSDDLLQPEFCERVGTLIDADPGIDAVGCDAERFTPGDDGMPRMGYFESVGRKSLPAPSQPVSLADMLEHGVPIYLGAIRREAWDAHDGYDPPTPDLELDVLLWLRLAAAGCDIRLLPERLTRIRVRPGSWSRDPSRIDEFEKGLLDAFSAICKYSPISEATVRGAGMVRRMRYDRALRRARWAFLDGDVQAARKAARDAYRHQHTLRATAVILALRLNPRMLRMIYPAKNRAQRAWRRASFRLAGGRAL